MTTARLYILVVLSLSTVRSDYPPPSEDGHGYYSRQSRRGGLVGRGRVTASFDGGYVGGESDWYSGSEWAAGGGGHHGLLGLSHARCVDIPDNLTLCRNIGYRQMRLPNLLDHDSMREVHQQASSWVRLVAVRCHPDTQVHTHTCHFIRGTDHTLSRIL